MGGIAGTSAILPARSRLLRRGRFAPIWPIISRPCNLDNRRYGIRSADKGRLYVN